MRSLPCPAPACEALPGQCHGRRGLGGPLRVHGLLRRRTRSPSTWRVCRGRGRDRGAGGAAEEVVRAEASSRSGAPLAAGRGGRGVRVRFRVRVRAARTEVQDGTGGGRKRQLFHVGRGAPAPAPGALADGQPRTLAAALGDLDIALTTVAPSEPRRCRLTTAAERATPTRCTASICSDGSRTCAGRGAGGLLSRRDPWARGRHGPRARGPQAGFRPTSSCCGASACLRSSGTCPGATWSCTAERSWRATDCSSAGAGRRSSAPPPRRMWRASPGAPDRSVSSDRSVSYGGLMPRPPSAMRRQILDSALRLFADTASREPRCTTSQSRRTAPRRPCCTTSPARTRSSPNC